MFTFVVIRTMGFTCYDWLEPTERFIEPDFTRVTCFSPDLVTSSQSTWFVFYISQSSFVLIMIYSGHGILSLNLKM